MKHQSGYAFTLLLLLAGCGGGGGSDSSTPATTKFNLAISDAPVDNAEKVCIAIESLSLNQSNGTTGPSWSNPDLLQTSDDDGCLPENYSIPKDSSGKPKFLYLDLLNYQGGSTFALLSNQLIASGDYGQLRLTVSDGRDETLTDLTGGVTDHPTSYVKTSSGVLPLYVPSSAVKLHPFTAPIGGELKYQLEFNLRHSLVFPGTADHYKLKPNGVQLLDVATLSRITGTVNSSYCSNNLTNAGVYLYDNDVAPQDYRGIDYDPEHNGPIATSSITDGSYTLHFIEPDSYKVVLLCNAADDDLTDDGNSFDFTPEVGADETPVVVPTPTNTETNNVITINIPAAS